MNLRRKGIIVDIFTKFGKEGFYIWFSGVKGEGEFKWWYDNGQMRQHTFYKNNKLNGEYKYWYENGQMWQHSFWKDGKKVKDL